MFHESVDLQCSLYLVILDTRINQTSIGDTVWDKLVLSHLVEHVEGVINQVSLSKCFDKDPMCDCRGLYSLSIHLLKDKYCPLDIIEPDTCVNQAVIEDFVRSKSALLLELIQQNESLVKIMIVAWPV